MARIRIRAMKKIPSAPETTMKGKSLRLLNSIHKWIFAGKREVPWSPELELRLHSH